MKTKRFLAISFAAVVAVSMIFALSLTQAEAINTNPKNPNAGGNHSPDFRIDSFGSDVGANGNLTMTVEGTAGATEPEESGDIYAYVWFFATWAAAATSHDFDDTTPDVTPREYHFHNVTLNGDGCVTDITEEINEPFTITDGSTISIEGIDLDSAPLAAATAVLNVDEDRPKGTVCVIHIFDLE